MTTLNSERETELAALLRQHLPQDLAPGLSGRVLKRLALEEGTWPQVRVETVWTHTWRLFPATAAAALLLMAGLAAWNMQTRPDGAWLDRVLALPAETLDNALTAQLEDIS
jgi:hypothetical protein